MELLEKYVMKISNNYERMDDAVHICPKISDKVGEKMVDMDIYNYLLECKNKIEQVESIKKWDYYKKLSNPYELVSKYIKSKNLNLGIADYSPISRAYYKFWELLLEFELINNNSTKITYGALAEGPGGFVEAFSFYRRKYGGFSKDTINCITLKSHSENIPNWKSIRGCKYNISWGEDGTGNLYRVRNILNYCSQFKNKADLVSADGGFDFSNNYYNVESSAQRLIFCEIVTALMILKKGGNFVVKMFDSFNRPSYDLLYILHIYFSEVYLVKPNTSRPANNEKYVVCKYFRGIKGIDIQKLLDIVNLMEQNSSVHISRFLTNEIPIDFIKVLDAYNIYSMKSQIYYILKTLIYVENKLTNNDVNHIIKKQSVYGILWCNKYDFNINKKSRFLNNEIHYYYMPYFSKFK